MTFVRFRIRTIMIVVVWAALVAFLIRAQSWPGPHSGRFNAPAVIDTVALAYVFAIVAYIVHRLLNPGFQRLSEREGASQNATDRNSTGAESSSSSEAAKV